MDIRSWCNSGASETIQLGHGSHGRGKDSDSLGSLASSSSSPRSKKLQWKELWLKLKRERKRMFELGSFEGHIHGPYDLYTYKQNFDHGIALEEPENLSRSFSVRFANSSRFLLRKKGGKTMN
ncbi:hypothetical protein CRG98_028783 [Punica granatum]|uniref:Uncharacterized protein n=1 Tax=Punica granatum TaxID=22663 RepID=A0A2I0J3H7_PUNGR|nr:hypothetical protein CRG98_028783 [Punica granatum]